MSYYSEVHSALQVREERFQEFLSALEQLTAKRNEVWVLHNLVSLLVSSDGTLRYDDLYGRHADTHKFAWWLKDFVKPGRLVYTSEEQERWGYEFDGQGRVFELLFVEQRGTELRRIGDPRR